MNPRYDFIKPSFRTKAVTVKRWGATGRRGPWRGRNDSGQALVIVLGIVMMLLLGTMAMAQNVNQHQPIVQRDLVVHEAYRAMQAGLDEYLYEANANPNYVMCDGSTVYTGYPGHWSATGSATLNAGLCSGLSLGTWTSVPDLAAVHGVPAWFTYGTPAIYDCTGTSAQCPTANTWESVLVVGAAGYTNDMSYQEATVSIQPTNNFLLSLWWLNYDQEDPVTINAQNPPDCGYYWQVGLVNNCQTVDFVTGETLNGNIYVNDSIFICGSPTLNGVVTSADPNHATIADPSDHTCSDSPLGSPTLVHGAPVEQAPTDDAVLGSVAAQNGCLYEGPTEIKLAENGSNVYGMDVYSPDTPAGSDGAAGSNDTLDNSTNANPCLSNAGQQWWVPYPSNGVVFIKSCTSCTGSTWNPLANVYQPDNAYEAVGPTEGDAIVEGTLQGPLTIAAQNNVVIDGNICYASWTNCTTPPASPQTADVLGLVAYNFVEVNHPMTNGGFGGWNNDSQCPSNVGYFGPGTTPNCDLQNPVIDAAILALNHQFDAHNFDQGASLGTVTIEGSIAEDWRGPVGTFGSNNTGYSKQYTYDSRLGYLSPPEYLNPGTSSWAIGAISAGMGQCPAAATACATVP
jgi:hypothetical protein